eukprot:scaffold2046_cov78-Phaeocystis_antarctica.AAC.1
MGAPLAARPLVAGGALGAVHAAEARGYVAGSVACPDVDGVILTEHARQTRDHSADHRVPSSNHIAGHGGESEAGACAIHVVTARCADDVVFRCGSVVKRPFTAAARVIVNGTIALGGGTDRARDANGRALRTVLSNLAWLTTEGVRGVVARSTDRALAAARVQLVRTTSARIARALARDGLDGARFAWCLLLAARWRKVTHSSLDALTGASETGGTGVCALLTRQRRAGALGAVRAGLAGDARLPAFAGLALAGGAPVTEGSARGGRNEAGRAVSAVGWVVAPGNRIGLPGSARLARRAARLAAVWVERAGGARRE